MQQSQSSEDLQGDYVCCSAWTNFLNQMKPFLWTTDLYRLLWRWKLATCKIFVEWLKVTSPDPTKTCSRNRTPHEVSIKPQCSDEFRGQKVDLQKRHDFVEDVFPMDNQNPNRIPHGLFFVGYLSLSHHVSWVKHPLKLTSMYQETGEFPGDHGSS